MILARAPVPSALCAAPALSSARLHPSRHDPMTGSTFGRAFRPCGVTSCSVGGMCVVRCGRHVCCALTEGLGYHLMRCLQGMLGRAQCRTGGSRQCSRSHSTISTPVHCHQPGCIPVGARIDRLLLRRRRLPLLLAHLLHPRWRLWRRRRRRRRESSGPSRAAVLCCFAAGRGPAAAAPRGGCPEVGPGVNMTLPAGPIGLVLPVGSCQPLVLHGCPPVQTLGGGHLVAHTGMVRWVRQCVHGRWQAPVAHVRPLAAPLHALPTHLSTSPLSPAAQSFGGAWPEGTECKGAPKAGGIESFAGQRTLHSPPRAH
jgi:hypothetical protein